MFAQVNENLHNMHEIPREELEAASGRGKASQFNQN